MLSDAYKRILVVFAMVATLGTPGLAQSDGSPLMLGIIDAELAGSTSVVNVRFNRTPKWKKPSAIEDHGSFLQLVLPGTVVPNPGQFIEGDGPYVKKIAVFQITQKDAAIRIFTDEKASVVKKALTSEVLGKRLMVAIDHKKLTSAQSSATTPQTSDSQSTGPIVSTQPSAASVGTEPPFQMRNKLIQVAAFIGLLIFLATAGLMLRPLLVRRRRQRGRESIGLKQIGSLTLSPKQKLVLVEVGGEKILVGVTPENINHISDIGRKPASMQSFGFHDELENAAHRPSRVKLKRPMQFSSPLVRGNRPARETARSQERDEAGTPLVRNQHKNQHKSAPQARSSAGQSENSRGVSEHESGQREGDRISGATTAQRRISVAVGDDGVEDLETREANAQSMAGSSSSAGSQKAIDDVTKMIRDRLKTLKSL